MLRGTPEPFSRRHGFRPSDPPITIWEDAPEDFRYAVLATAREKCSLEPHDLRDIVCRVLRKRPDPNNWTPYPNVWNEVESHVENCEWYKLYDIVEAIWAELADKPPRVSGQVPLEAHVFEAEVNGALRELGIGWQLRDGMIQARGEEAFEAVLAQAKDALVAAGKATAQNELGEAIKDISRRPHPDTTGAIQHCMAALECVAKDVTGESKATLGQILARHATVVPKSLDVAVDKVWGFASDRARHVREGHTLDRHDAQLVVGLAASLASYLVQKAKPGEG
jgi:AbiJ N-terminal domain 4